MAITGTNALVGLVAGTVLAILLAFVLLLGLSVVGRSRRRTSEEGS